MKLAAIAILSATFAWLLCYGAMRTAEKMAANVEHQIEDPLWRTSQIENP